jgi:hypothetical protein
MTQMAFATNRCHRRWRSLLGHAGHSQVIQAPEALGLNTLKERILRKNGDIKGEQIKRMHILFA